MALTLTPKQKEILDFIRAYRQKRGLSPTQREICEEFGYSSFGTLQKHIKLLLEKGVLVRDWNKRRSLVLAEEDRRAGAVEIDSSVCPKNRGLWRATRSGKTATCTGNSRLPEVRREAVMVSGLSLKGRL